MVTSFNRPQPASYRPATERDEEHDALFYNIENAVLRHG